MPSYENKPLPPNDLLSQNSASAEVDALEYAETVKAIQEGIDSIERGEGRPANEVLDELQHKFTVSITN